MGDEAVERRRDTINLDSKLDKLIEKQEESNLQHAQCSARTATNIISIKDTIQKVEHKVDQLTERVLENKGRINGFDSRMEDKVYIAVSEELRGDAKRAGSKAAKKTVGIWGSIFTGIAIFVIKLIDYFSSK